MHGTKNMNLFTPINQMILTASTFKKLIAKNFLWTYQNTELYLNQTNDLPNVVEKYFRPSSNKTAIALVFMKLRIVLRSTW